jgi:hypothetical protein
MQDEIVARLANTLGHELGQRFLVSNHIRQRRRFCRTKCG